MFEIARVEGILVIAVDLRIGLTGNWNWNCEDLIWYRGLDLNYGRIAQLICSVKRWHDNVIVFRLMGMNSNPFSVNNANAISAYPGLPFILHSLYLYPFPVSDGCEE